MDVFIGTIMSFGFNFAPRGWAVCNGAMVSIAQNTALFSLLGTYYGGNGQTTFGLPDLQGRVAIGQGTGAGLSAYTMGQKGGTQNVTLTVAQMPAHNHPFTGGGSMMVSSSPGTSPTPSATTNTLAAMDDPNTGATNNAYNNASPNITLNTGSSGGGAVGINGGSQPFSVLQPYLAINYSIALFGIFPSRD